MNKNKSKIVIFSLLITILSCLILLCACGGGEESEIAEIYIGKNGVPKKVLYVQGQELDLNGGVVTAVDGNGSESSIPMTADTVSVTGYDANVLGKQNLSVSYSGKSTTFEVTVVARMTADSYETNYFVNDEIDKTKGKLRIYRDDASLFSVNLSDDSITLDYDFSNAGKVTVSVKCNHSDGKEYTGSFDVTVHNIAEVEFKSPSKTVYRSHEEFSIKGGYFTVKSDSDFSKYVNITENMYTGYAPDSVTEQNLYEPMKQTVVFSYAGRTFEFGVDVYYSSMYFIEEVVEALPEYDWTDKETKVEEQDGEKALAALECYYNLSADELVLIDNEIVESMVRPAAVYLHELYLKEFERFSDVFILTNSGFGIIAKSYEAVVQASENFKNEDDMLNVYAALLRDVYDDFTDLEYTDTVKLSSKIFVHTEEYQESTLMTFKYMLELYDMLKNIPEDWDNEDLEQNASIIEDTVTKIRNSGYGGYQNYQVYNLVSNWRTKDDFVEIIYSYYMYVCEGGQEKIGESIWKEVPLPGILCDWYRNYSMATNESRKMKKNESSTAYLQDVSIFMHYYTTTMDLSEQIKNHESALYREIYELLGGDIAIERDIINPVHTVDEGGYGYLYHLGAVLDSDNVMTLWNDYIELLSVFITSSYISINDYDTEFQNIMRSFTELSAAEVYEFLCSMHFMYDTSEGSTLILDTTDGARDYFVYILSSYYSKKLSEDAFKIYQQLLIAIETYAWGDVKPVFVEDFKYMMSQICEAYGDLSQDEQDTFMSYVGDCYNKYVLIYEILTEEKTVALGTYEAKFNEIKNLADAFDVIFAYVTNEDYSDESKSAYYPILFAIYEKIDSLRQEIDAAEGGIYEMFLVSKYEFGEDEYTLDKKVCKIRETVLSYLIGTKKTVGEEEIRAWDLYSNSNLDEFLEKAVYLSIYAYNSTLSGASFDLNDIIEAYYAMSDEEKNLFFALGFSNTYYVGLKNYLSGIYTNAEALNAIINADIAYAVYSIDPTDEKKEEFLSKFAAAVEIYTALEDKETFNSNFGAIYEYCNEKYESLNAPANA